MWNNKYSNSCGSSKNAKPSTVKTSTTYKPILKKVIPSMKFTCAATDHKSCSTGMVHAKRCPTRPRVNTKSEEAVTTKSHYNIIDYCKNCGDAVERISNVSKKDLDTILSSMNVKSVRNDNAVNRKKNKEKPIKQYYKNENFLPTTESMQLHDTEPVKIAKNDLDTIKESSEFHSTSQDSIYMIRTESDDRVTNLDPDDTTTIQKLKEFRSQNYFECHSAKSRIKTKASVTSLPNHKCVYRFYLNDRLFPVPLNTDYNNKVRCVECHLPMDIKKDSEDKQINGTIQAKVKIGNETQDMVLLLPIKESLIITERRKEERKVDNEYVYFGVVKLSSDGNSVFNKTLPHDSLALKYQKGYKKLQFDERFTYKNVDDNDVIVI